MGKQWNQWETLFFGAPFIYKYLLSIYYVPGMVLEAEASGMNKTEKFLISIKLQSSKGRKTVNE